MALLTAKALPVAVELSLELTNHQLEAETQVT
jgi:hypothetical protein